MQPAGEGSPPFLMNVTMVVAKYPEYPPVEDGEGTVKVPTGDKEITANTRIVRRFNGVNQNGKSLDQRGKAKMWAPGCENCSREFWLNSGNKIHQTWGSPLL